MLLDFRLKPEFVRDIKANDAKLALHRIDMFAATELGGWAAIAKQYPNETNNFRMAKQQIHSITGDIIFSKDKAQLQKEFRLGFQEIKHNGTYLSILKKYYGNRQIPAELLVLRH